jgi:hypothetical protein
LAVRIAFGVQGAADSVHRIVRSENVTVSQLTLQSVNAPGDRRGRCSGGHGLDAM